VRRKSAYDVCLTPFLEVELAMAGILSRSYNAK